MYSQQSLLHAICVSANILRRLRWVLRHPDVWMGMRMGRGGRGGWSRGLVLVAEPGTCDLCNCQYSAEIAVGFTLSREGIHTRMDLLDAC